jgi:hypothetical protein
VYEHGTGGRFSDPSAVPREEDEARQLALFKLLADQRRDVAEDVADAGLVAALLLGLLLLGRAAADPAAPRPRLLIG